MRRTLLFYFVAVSVFVTGVYFLLASGKHLQSTGNSQVAITQSASLISALSANLHEPLSILLLQVVVIIVAARLAGLLFQRLGQPAVIGEMVAGIILGPSLLGAVFPAVQAFLFPASSLGLLRT